MNVDQFLEKIKEDLERFKALIEQHEKEHGKLNMDSADWYEQLIMHLEG